MIGAMKIADRLLLIFICLMIYFPGNAQNIIVKPFLQNASPQEMTIMWEAEDIGVGNVYYGPTPFDMNIIEVSSSIEGQGISRIHSAVLSSLIPGTKYYYKIIMAGGEASQLYTFLTPEDSSAESATQLIAISDMQRDGSHPNKFQEIIEQGIIPIINSEIGTMNDLEGLL